MDSRSRQQQRSDTFHVLVIDDDPIARELTVTYLDRAWPFERGLVAHFAGDGGEALDKIRSVRFALIVLDWRLPVVAGSEVLQQIRTSGSRIPVVVISGLRREDIAEDLDLLGAAFLGKEHMNADTFHSAIASSLRLLGFTKLTGAANHIEGEGVQRGVSNPTG